MKKKETLKDKNWARREYPRLPKSNIVSYAQSDGLLLGDLEGMAITRNIGLGGVLIRIDHSFPIVGNYIHLELAIEDAIIKAKGKIVHVRDRGENRFDTGIQFVDIAEDDLQLLKSYLEKSGILKTDT
ncbi:PilZ domain-containing protein [bacterium]|nr:PilZ domain-containing protein [bacterium]